MSRHRAPRRRLKVNYGRILALGFASVVMGIALLGTAGVIPIKPAADDVAADAASDTARAAGQATDLTGQHVDDTRRDVTDLGAPENPTTPRSTPTQEPPTTTQERTTGSTALPDGTGSGRRIVFSEEEQRVWLVGRKGTVVDTYLVSGSVTDNLHPGSYNVYSRSRWAVGIDDSGVMQYFVRFTRGDNAAIGFHSIPTKNGNLLQTLAQLGTPQSHGCIRQKLSDAKRMWEFARVGTDVVVI